MNTPYIKICGITNLDDALAACDAGADAIGFVFADSPRRIDVDTAARIRRSLARGIECFGVFRTTTQTFLRDIVNEVGLDALQIHGDVSGMPGHIGGAIVVPVLNPRNVGERLLSKRGIRRFVIDASEGRGIESDISHVTDLLKGKPYILAGGLDSENVAEAIIRYRPLGVDVSSGVEFAPGVKDHMKMRSFCTACKEVEAHA